MRKPRYSGFDRLAKIYDALAQFVFGKAITNAQQAYLSQIPKNAKVLILGGGTGELLSSLLEHCPTVQVDFVELSEPMVAQARKRLRQAGQQVHFLTMSYDKVEDSKVYDVIITPFFLDLFPTSKAHQIIRQFTNQLSPKGIWLYADFQNQEAIWKRVLLWSMYRFFRLFCGIEAQQLPEVKSCFVEEGMLNLHSSTYYHGMIKSVCYQKEER